MKKQLICIMLALVATNTLAEGPYLGASLGFSDSQATEVFKETDSDDEEIDFGVSGPIAILFGGYRHDLNGDAFVSAEFNIQLSSASGGVESGADDITIDQNLSFGGSALLGTQLGAGVIFVRLGIQLTEYEVSGTILEGSFNEQHTGIRLGTGFELPVNETLHARMGWDRTFYGEESYDSGPGFSENLKPTASLFALSLISHF